MTDGQRRSGLIDGREALERAADFHPSVVIIEVFHEVTLLQ